MKCGQKVFLLAGDLIICVGVSGAIEKIEQHHENDLEKNQIEREHALLLLYYL